MHACPGVASMLLALLTFRLWPSFAAFFAQTLVFLSFEYRERTMQTLVRVAFEFYGGRIVISECEETGGAACQQRLAPRLFSSCRSFFSSCTPPSSFHVSLSSATHMGPQGVAEGGPADAAEA